MQQSFPFKPTLTQRNCGYLWRLVMALMLSLSLLALSPRIAQAAFDCNSVTEIPVAECEALVALYNSTDGPNWIDQHGWLVTTTPCTWFGVVCEGTSHVTFMELSANGLNGAIPPEFGNLTSLWFLNLAGNQLSGAIPPEFGNLRSLSFLYLGGNQLSGAIPPEFGNLTNAWNFYLGPNQFSSLPAEIGNLINLETLDLYNNQLNSLPPEIGKLTRLVELQLSRNQLSSLPPEIGKLAGLNYLYLNSNQLSSLPAEIGNLSYLVDLDLTNNQLSSLPPEIGNLSILIYLWLSNNELSSLPPEIGNLSSMESLHLSNNELKSLPTEIGNVAHLSDLRIFGNLSLSGPLPASLVQITHLTVFYFHDTKLCEPADAVFQSWLAGIPDLKSTNVICPGSPPPPPPSTSLRLSLFTSEVMTGSVTLHWDTEAEADNLGFNLYRLAADSDTATKVNAELIPAQGNAETGATYQFVDRPGSGEYIYLIKNVDQQGVEHLRGQVEVEAEGYVFFLPALTAP